MGPSRACWRTTSDTCLPPPAYTGRSGLGDPTWSSATTKPGRRTETPSPSALWLASVVAGCGSGQGHVPEARCSSSPGRVFTSSMPSADPIPPGAGEALLPPSRPLPARNLLRQRRKGRHRGPRRGGARGTLATSPPMTRASWAWKTRARCGSSPSYIPVSHSPMSTTSVTAGCTRAWSRRRWSPTLASSTLSASAAHGPVPLRTAAALQDWRRLRPGRLRSQPRESGVQVPPLSSQAQVSFSRRWTTRAASTSTSRPTTSRPR